VHRELTSAVAFADLVCTWQENYLPDEMPPQWMWPYPDQLNAHFDMVHQARKDGRPMQKHAVDVQPGDNEYAVRALKQLGIK
jgi:hypothetical protein